MTTRELAGLVVVLTIAIVASIYWTYRVPFYQQPDELAHADYVFALYDAKTAYVVRDGDAATEVAPNSRYLAAAVTYRKMRYNPYGRAPESYGTVPYFRAVDAAAPDPSGHVPRAGDRIPYMMKVYPYTYYAVAFAVFSIAEAVTHSLTTGFFAMRELGVVAIAVTLCLGFLTLRRYGIATAPALATTLGIGVFPLITAIASSIQPDTFVIAFVALALYGGSLLRDRRVASIGYALLCIALCGLAMTKQHYAGAVWIATLPLALAKSRRGDWPWLAAMVALPPVALVFAYTSFGPVHGIESAVHFVGRTHAAQTADGNPPPVWQILASSVASALDGSTAHSFWLTFGFRGGRIFGDRTVSEFVVGVVDIAFTIALAIVEYRTLSRIVRIARRRSPVRALALVASGHALNVFLAVTLVLFAAAIASSGALELQGRYWAPVTLALAIVTLVTLPRGLRVPERRRVTRVLATSLGGYGSLAFVCATVAMNASYYGPPKASAYASVAEIRSSHDVVASSGTATISGVAVDMQTGFPVTSVYAKIDGSSATIFGTTGLPSPALARLFNDPAVGSAGFAIRIPTQGLGVGSHTVTVYVGHAGSGGALPIRDRVTIEAGRPG